MKYLCYINNEFIEEIFLLPSPFSMFPSRYLFKGTFVERGLGAGSYSDSNQ